MARHLVFDSDILIEYLRDVPKAAAFLEARDEIFVVSTVTVAELFTGVRSEAEEAKFDHFLQGFEVIPVSEHLAREGGRLRHAYHPSHGTGLADAIIAATVLDLHAAFTTFNIKHFPMIDDIIVPYER